MFRKKSNLTPQNGRNNRSKTSEELLEHGYFLAGLSQEMNRLYTMAWETVALLLLMSFNRNTGGE